MAPHSSTLVWQIPWREEPGRLQSMGLLGVGHEWVTSLSLFTFMHWRRKWQPTPCSCLENPRDGGAWWSAVYGVTPSWTRLRRLRKKKKSKSEVQTTNNSHFPGFVSWETPEPNSFSKIWDEVVTGVCVCVLLFPELHITFQFYQGFSLLEDYVKLLFCVNPSFNMTRIHFSTERPLVKIL